MKTAPYRTGLGMLCVATALSAHAISDDLQAPFRVESNSQPIDVDIGHAAPFITDFDGDGVFDLLVGQFGEGKLRIYRNRGSNTEPKFGAFAWFQAAGADGKVPSG